MSTKSLISKLSKHIGRYAIRYVIFTYFACVVLRESGIIETDVDYGMSMVFIAAFWLAVMKLLECADTDDKEN